MTVTVAELKPMTPEGVDKFTFTAGEKVRYWIKVINTGFFPASPKDVYLLFGPKGGPLRRIATIRTGWIGGAGPGGEEIHTYDYTIPTSTSPGYYWIGARTEEDTEAVVREIQIAEPVPPGVSRLDIKTLPSGATIYVDGKKVGTSPIMVDVVPGTHDIKIELSGYKVEEAVGAEVISEDTVRATVSMEEVKTVVVSLKPIKPTAELWKSAWFWGLAGLGVGAVLAVKKKPEYVRRAKEVVKPYAERAKKVVKPYAERVVGAVKR